MTTLKNTTATDPVVITGLGVISPLANDIAGFWSALCRGTSGIGEITVCDLSNFKHRCGGEVKSCQLPEPFQGKLSDQDRAATFAVSAAYQAVTDANLADFSQTAVVLASNFGSVATLEKDLGTDADVLYGEAGLQHCSNIIADYYHCCGPSSTLSLSCSSGAAAIGYGLNLIRSGRADCVIAGGYDAISSFAWTGLSSLRTMTEEMIRPFSKNRSGTLFAEGAGVVILESKAHAQMRQAQIYAEIAGFACNNNAFHMTAPPKGGEGLAAVMQMALTDAGLSPEQLDHVNTHGTGTQYNDSTETIAIKSVLKDHAANAPITSLKSMTGHMMGAAGAVETIAAILSLKHNLIPPTINYSEADPACDLPIVLEQSLSKELHAVLCNSSGIGGNNASLVVTT